MSVAFRRESDDEHLEPRFELPIPPGPNRVTARGAGLIAARVADLHAQLAATDDEAARKALARDLRYWQTRQVTAEIMPVPDGTVVAFGTTVTFAMGGKQRVLSLVGDGEADPAAGLVAWTAPLARALTGAEPGETIAFGGRDDAITVIAITPIGG